MQAVESHFEELKEHFRFGEADARRLADVAPRMVPHLRRVVQRLHEHLRKHEDVAGVFTDEARTAQLEDACVAWLERVFSGVYDAAHLARTEEIAGSYVRLGVPQRCVLTAMAFLRSSLLDLVDSNLRDEAPVAGDDAERSGATRRALSHLLDVELATILEHYRRDLVLERSRQDQRERLASVGVLAAGLAHEIRNPLNGARLHLSLLQRSLSVAATSPDSLDALRVIDDEIKRLARLVSEFLEYARPDPLVYVKTSAQALCHRVRDVLAEAATVAGVELTLDLPARDVVFGADVERIEQALAKLVSNAIEALEPTGGRVILRARAETHQVVIEVEDDGPGIRAAPVFEAFFSTKPGGTGLGLAIVHRIVTDHGGSIDVDSQRGRTRFRVLLPNS